MDEGLMDRLVAEAIAQGFTVWTASTGARVFALGNTLIICRVVPGTADEWRILLRDLTRAGLLWPPRNRGR
jgi:hypothetical protein